MHFDRILFYLFFWKWENKHLKLICRSIDDKQLILIRKISLALIKRIIVFIAHNRRRRLFFLTFRNEKISKNENQKYKIQQNKTEKKNVLNHSYA